jgi:Uncharacterized conserved protein related to C-terminal domain of eukaryotic chaperone, SACSIN
MNSNARFWEEMADYDLETAMILLDAGKLLYVGLMCHKSIEKVLKAVIAVKFPDRQVPISMNLTILIKDADLAEDLDDGKRELLNTLNRLQLEAGYPTMDSNVLEWMTQAECRRLIEETKKLYNWIKKTSVNRRKIGGGRMQ